MLIKNMNVTECWCPECGHGQMEQIMDITFKEKIQLVKMIGRTVKCKECGNEEIIDDVINLIPQTFLVQSSNDLMNYKKDESVAKFYEDE